MKTPQMTLSYSGMQRMNCPLLFWKTVHGMKSPSAPQLLAGSAVHEMVVHALNAMEATAEDLAGTIQTLPPDLALDAAKVAMKARKFQVYDRRALELAMGFTADLELIVARQGDAWPKVYYSDPAPAFFCKIDLMQVTDILETHLVDWKSGWSREGDPRQAKIYTALVDGAALALKIPDGIRRFIFSNLRNDEWSEIYTFEADELSEIREELKAQIRVYQRQFEAAMEKKERDFPPCPGPHCWNCAHRLDCVAGYLEPMSKETMEEAANRLNLLEAQVASLKDGVKAWCLENGPTGGYGFKARNSTTWDAPKTIKAAGGLDSALEMGIVNINGTKAGKLKKKPEFQDCFTEEQETTFGRIK